MYFDEIKIGDEFTTEEAQIDNEKMIAFAKEYDPLPLHYDEDYAKNTRYGKIIAPGVMSFMTVWAKISEKNIFGDALIAGKSTKIEWHKPVFAGDVLTGRCVVTRLEQRNAYNGIVEHTIYVHNQNDELVLTNVTESIVKIKE